MLQKSPLCLIWPPKGGEGKARDTVFISTVVLFRLINAEFHKKIGSFGAGAAPDVYLKEKPRGGFLSASSH